METYYEWIVIHSRLRRLNSLRPRGFYTSPLYTLSAMPHHSNAPWTYFTRRHHYGALEEGGKALCKGRALPLMTVRLQVYMSE